MTDETANDKEIIVEVDEDLEDLIPGFLENRQKDIVALRAALEHNDFETARDIGHGLKGAGGGYGFHIISELGRDIEQAGRNRDASALKTHIDALDDVMSRANVVYVPVDDRE
jgi:HPt (histidine-containing phosphotransfer) domain-containing protein